MPCVRCESVLIAERGWCEKAAAGQVAELSCCWPHSAAHHRTDGAGEERQQGGQRGGGQAAGQASQETQTQAESQQKTPAQQRPSAQVGPGCRHVTRGVELA